MRLPESPALRPAQSVDLSDGNGQRKLEMPARWEPLKRSGREGQQKHRPDRPEYHLDGAQGNPDGRPAGCERDVCTSHRAAFDASSRSALLPESKPVL